MPRYGEEYFVAYATTEPAQGKFAFREAQAGASADEPGRGLADEVAAANGASLDERSAYFCRAACSVFL